MVRGRLIVVVISLMALLPLVPMLAVAGAEPVEVRGAGISCPSAAEVAQQIGLLLPPGAAFDPSEWVELREVPSTRASSTDLEVRLQRQGVDAPLGVRRLERAGTCADLAEAAAVVATSWKGQFALPEPAVPVVIQVPSPATGAPSMTVVATPSPGSARRIALGVAGFGGAVTGGAGGLAPLAGVEGEFRRGEWLARLQAAAAGSRDVSIAGGRAEWQRALVGLAAGRDLWRSERMSLDATVGPVLGITRVRGVDFAVPGQALGLDVGVAPAVRLGRWFPRLRMAAWVSASGAAWLRSHVVAVDGASETRALPRIEGSVVVGVTYSPGR